MQISLQSYLASCFAKSCYHLVKERPSRFVLSAAIGVSDPDTDRDLCLVDIDPTTILAEILKRHVEPPCNKIGKSSGESVGAFRKKAAHPYAKQCPETDDNVAQGDLENSEINSYF